MLKTILRTLVTVLTVVALVHVSVASALDKATQGLLFPMYGENAPVCSADGAPGSITPGKDNEETIFRYLLGKGLSAYQVAGIMGNLRQESGFNPKSQQDGSHDPMPKDGVGFGIAQWTFTSRQQPLVNLAAKASKPPTDLGIQLDYLWQELNGPYKKSTLDLLRQVKAPVTKNDDPVANATLIFHNGFEKSADTAEMLQRRVRYSKESLQLMIDRKVVDPASVALGENTGVSGGACSGAGVIIDGFAWPRAPMNKSAYSPNVLPICKNVVNSGPNTRGGIYTDSYGTSTAIKTCHHDGSPAFDLMAGNGGQDAYAITDGEIVRRGTDYHGVPGCTSIQYHSVDAAGGYYYWYGHQMNPDEKIALNTPVKAGTRLSSIATAGANGTRDFGSDCYGGGPHLHIDSGCVDKQGKPHTGGNLECRRPGFLDQLGKLYEALP